MLSIFYQRADLGKKKGEKAPQNPGTRQSASIFQKSLRGTDAKDIFYTLLDNIYLLKPWF